MLLIFFYFLFLADLHDYSLQRFKMDVASTVVNQQNAGLGTMETDQILDLFNFSDADNNVNVHPHPSTGDGDQEMMDVNADDAIDVATGQVKEKGKKGLLEDIGELWDDDLYREEYNLDSFLASMKH